MVPAISRLLDDFDDHYPGPDPQHHDGFVNLNGGLVSLLQEISSIGPVAYIETDYYGGVGSQAGATFVNGEPVVIKVEPEVKSVERTIGPINSALRALGVARTESLDEFDSLGLGRFRSMEDWERGAGT